MLRRERWEQVRRAVWSLRPRYREVVVLRYLEGLDDEGVAEALGISHNTVRVRLHRARHQLKGELSQLLSESIDEP